MVKSLFGKSTGADQLEASGAVVSATLMGRSITMSPQAVAKVAAKPSANAPKSKL